MERQNSRAVPHDVRVRVGHNIRSWRNKRRLPLKVVADKAGCSLQAISQIERGLIDAKTSTLVAIAEALGVSPVEFFRDASTTARYLSVESPKILSLLAAVMKLPDSWQDMLVILAEKIASDVNGARTGRY